MVDFPSRIEPTRRNVREILGGRSYDAAILDEWPVLVRPVTGQQPPNDSAYQGENLDLLISQFITRLRTPGSQVSATALQTLVATVTEMVNVLSQNAQQPPQPGQKALAPNTPPVPQQGWQPSLPQDMPVYAPLKNGNNEGYIGANETNFSGFGAAGEFPAAWENAGTQNWYGVDGASYQDTDYGIQGPSWGSDAYSSYSMGNAYSALDTPSGNIYFPQPQYTYATPEIEKPVPPEEDKLAPISAIKREFVPQGIPVSFFADSGEDALEEEPTLFDFIATLPVEVRTSLH